MGETEQTKVCPLCAETIKAAAKVCPYCRKSQGQWFFLNLYDLSAIAAVLICIAAIVPLISLSQTKRDFSLDRDKVGVLELHFTPAGATAKTNMVAFGIITNDSEHSWAIERFEIRYLDNKGKLLGMDDQPEEFTILPKSNHSFRLDLDSYSSAPDYARCEVKVLSANDPRSGFQLFGDD
jgi:hypothetical protein